MGSPRPVLIWVWTALFVAGVALTALALARFWRREGSAPAKGSQQEIPAAVLFGGVTLAVGVLGYASFLDVLNYYTQPWYYITLASFAACAMEVVFGAWSPVRNYPILSLVLKGGRLVVAFLLLAAATGPAWRELRTRHTNVDLVAEGLKTLTSAGDVIIVPRWECAITLCRYYHGPAAVVTLPPIADHRFHRYDLVLTQMMTPDAIQPVLHSSRRRCVTAIVFFWRVPCRFPEPTCASRTRLHFTAMVPVTGTAGLTIEIGQSRPANSCGLTLSARGASRCPYRTTRRCKATNILKWR